MYALKVQINAEHRIIAGTNELSVLAAAVNWIGKPGENTVYCRYDESPDLCVTVGGA